MADKKTLEIRCRGAGTISIDLLTPLQGDLKRLNEVDYLRLVREMEKNGFSEPISIWEDKGSSKLYVLNGHQRLATLKRMKEEGWHIPQVPVSYVEAENELQAKRKILALTSQFGEMTENGLKQFLDDCDITLEELGSDFRLPDIDIPDFIDKFFSEQDDGDIGNVNQKPSDGDEPDRVHSAGVRMVQLFFNENDHAKFLSRLKELMERYGVDNVTDAVSLAVEHAHNQA